MNQMEIIIKNRRGQVRNEQSNQRITIKAISESCMESGILLFDFDFFFLKNALSQVLCRFMINIVV